MSQTITQQQQTQTHHQIVWKNVLIFIYLHTAAFYGFYLFCKSPKISTFVWIFVLMQCTNHGIVSGAHRLWTHRTYKAKLPLRIYLAFFQTVSLQNHIYEWARDHRVHHKFAETDADPHNVKRGFFFSHMGWLLVKKHSDVITKGRTVDLSDLEADPVVRFQRKYYLIIAPLCCFILPAFVPWYFWGESAAISWNTCAILRYMITLHITWLVNSYAHMFGNKPYDKNIGATESKFVSYLGNGEGFHNYHHTFPWDYKAAELGTYDANLNTALIDLMAKIGWASDLKTASKEMVENQCRKRGDGSREATTVF